MEAGDGASANGRAAAGDNDGERGRDAAHSPIRVAYFGPDLDDPAVRRRVAQWRFAGFEVLATAFARRGSSVDCDGTINLGRVKYHSRLRRIVPLALAGLRLFSMRKRLAGADLFIARNVDNAFLALFARRITRSTAPLVYEVLDINTSFTTAGPQAFLLRRVEQWVLARTCLLVVSSPHFVSAYYQKLLDVAAQWVLFENKVPRYARVAGSRPAAAPAPIASGGAPRWRIGWFGYLDDEKSWHILRRAAAELRGRVSILVRGMPYNNFDMENFLRDIEALDNAVYGGPFRNPEDLAAIYGAVDLVWSADCNELDANSKWLLTNGIYEAGYFGKPVIGLARTAIGEFLNQMRSGWSLEAPAEESLIALLASLTPGQYEAKRQCILEQSETRFVETDEIKMIWTAVQNRSVRKRLPRVGAEPPQAAAAATFSTNQQ